MAEGHEKTDLLGFWRRNNNDPLLRTFLDKYNLNLLSVPREKAAVGDLYVYDGKRVSAPGSASRFFDPPLRIPPITLDEDMADVAGKLSQGVSASLGLGLLEAFLIAFGATDAVGKIRAGYETSRTTAVRFRFARATRDSVDVMLLGSELEGCRFAERHPFYSKDNQYFLVTAVARTPSISIVAESRLGTFVEMDVGGLNVGEASGAVAVKKSGKGEITFRGKKKLAFGVELHEIQYDRARDALVFRIPTDPVRVRGSATSTVRPAFIGENDGDAFVEVE